jgi:hypothetical protein
MAKRTILIAVVAFLAFASLSLANSWFDFYYSFGVQGVNNSGHNLGNWDSDNYNTISATGSPWDYNVFLSGNPTDDTATVAFLSQSANMVHMAIAGFSYNHDEASGMTIDEWLASPYKTLLFSTTKNIGPYATPNPGANDSIYALASSGMDITVATERLIVHCAPLVRPATGSETVPPGEVGITVPDHTLGVGFPTVAMADFQLTTTAPDQNPITQRIYWTAANTAVDNSTPFSQSTTMARPNVVYHMTTGPVLGQYRGSGYGDTAHAGDVLTVIGQNYVPTYGIFENAWKIAGVMLGDKFWESGLVWNNYKGYVSTSTASTAAEAAGHLAMKNFMLYIFAITAAKVQDMDGDGIFDVGDDKIMFTVAADANNQSTNANAWSNLGGGTWTAPWKLAGQFFPNGLGNAIYIYDGDTVTTYMGKDTGLFFGEAQTTSAATIWAGAYGNYMIGGFDLSTFIPEPSTIILLIGSGLALGAGILRRRMR